MLLISCSLYNYNLPRENRHSRSYYKETFWKKRQLYTSPSLFTQPAETPLQHEIAWRQVSAWGTEKLALSICAPPLINKGSKETLLLGCCTITALKSRRTCSFNKEEQSCKRVQCPLRWPRNKKGIKQSCKRLHWLQPE